MRTDKHEWFLDLAERCAKQGTCLRRNFGAVIVDQNNTIISTGYTGAPSKQKDCTQLQHCWREDNNIPSGTQYEKCRSVHAEQNAIIQAGKNARNSILYLAGIDAKTGKIVEILPCFLCAKMIINSGVSEVIIRMLAGAVHFTPSEIYDKRFLEAFGNME